MGAMNVPFSFVACDLETTGTDPHNDRVVELALVFYAPNQEPMPWRSLVNPGIPIPDAASKIHGIYDWDVSGAPAFADLLGEITPRLRQAKAIVGYNARRFDVPMLQAEFQRAGGTWPVEGMPIIDPFSVWAHVEPRTLVGAAKHWLNEDLQDAHGALPDAVCAARVLLAQLDKHDALPHDPATLEAYVQPKGAENWLDPDGKLLKTEAGVVIAFGKHKGTALTKAPPDYLRWMLEKMSLPTIARQAIQAALPA